jgi:2-keto-3-deoxy-L-rhamnonate aldolase RhmA
LNTLEIKDSLRQGKVVIGTWVFEFNSPGLPRLLKSSGADFVVYDMEHSGFGVDSVRNLIALSRPLNLAALVRPQAWDYHLIAPLLDIGAAGIIAPKVEHAIEASKIVDSCRYHPDGHRGAAFSIAHDDFLPGDIVSKMRAANEAVLCAALIETAEGVKNIEEILEVDGIDLIWVGFLDLSISMGIPGQFSSPQFHGAINRIIRACESRRKPVGILAADPTQALNYIQRGFRCISYSADLWLLQRALSDGIRAIKAG